MKIRPFLTFDKFMAPKFIQVVYFMLIAASCYLGYIIMNLNRGHLRNESVYTFSGVLLGLFTIVILVVMSRLACELALVAFRINENLETIRDKKKD